ncbi:Lrp/AsnC family transcriptional regulator [Microterricola viridarii]|uniref:Transcriptional regulator, AsnC family n=1 Tax=Microterricola viridarii TaxID=412690 RepID=A0A1H1N787_9MICO|nr:Lrp/AsnC family transcriptional regulator [Microterricola viridarii]SDR94883.1 transcriptional regulator, AsnC family [Microterricola viridarii]
MSVDALDYAIVKLFAEEPGVSVVEASRRLGVARITVQARLSRMHENGVIERIEPRLNPAAFGYPVSAITHVELDQGVGYAVAFESLRQIPEVIDMYTTSGDSDVVIRMVARSNSDLQRVFDAIMQSKAVTRTRSSIVLETQFENKVMPLFAAAAAERSTPDRRRTAPHHDAAGSPTRAEPAAPAG